MFQLSTFPPHSSPPSHTHHNPLRPHRHPSPFYHILEKLTSTQSRIPHKPHSSPSGYNKQKVDNLT